MSAFEKHSERNEEALPAPQCLQQNGALLTENVLSRAPSLRSGC
jgi:hypothetical protein